MNSSKARIPFERIDKPHPEVIVAATCWVLNGVNIFSANLVRGLCSQGIPGQILLTEEDTALVHVSESSMPKPSDIPFYKLPVRHRTSWGGHWGATIRYLEERTPCIYIPNYDWRHSCVSPLLSNKVGIVGIVHSDDPLHYDHVSRLGQYWNAIIATSRTIAEKAAALNPSLTGRIVVIPIGVDIPFKPPKERPNGERPLRMIYHGVLRQHQKRILDLPKVISELAARKIPIELSIAGSGPDEIGLKEACKELVARGMIRFLGVVPHDAIFDLLEHNDVYVLTSEFEGMPNALLEAMGRGCVPVVTNMESAIPQLVQDGDNGFVVPIGDIGAFTDGLTILQRDHNLRQRMALNAYERVNRGKYRIQDMLRDYIEVFDRVLNDVQGGVFQRPANSLQPPPAEVAGVNIFQVALSYQVEGVGLFPTRSPDYREFKEQIRFLEGSQVPSVVHLKQQVEKLKDVQVVIASPSWTYTGVNEFSANLVRGLMGKGIRAEILLTEENTDLVNVTEPRMPRPSDVPFTQLPLERTSSWGGRWGAMIRYLEERAPCIYIPNCDWRHSCVSPLLSNRVAIVGVTHQDDLLYYDHAQRLGRYWNAIVAISDTIAEKIKSLDSSLAQRVTVIPHGLNIPSETPDRSIDPAVPLNVVCQGIFDDRELQMVSSLVRILRRREVPVEIALISAAGKSRTDILAHFPEPQAVQVFDDLPQDMMRETFEGADVVIMASKFDGVQNRLAEAMGRGCIPMVVEDERAMQQLIRDGENGFILPATDMKALADRLTLLQRDVSQRHIISLKAHETARSSVYPCAEMIEDYIETFSLVADQIHRGAFERHAGTLQPPPAEVNGVSIFPVELSSKVEGVGLFPTRSPDYREFKEQIRFLEGSQVPSVVHLKQQVEKLKDVQVVIASPSWTYTGVNEFSANLVRGLMGKGIRAEILLTEENTDLVNVTEPRMPRPSDVPFTQLPLERTSSWGGRWGAMIRYLEERAPCIYIPNCDWRHSCVSPLLSNRVAIVGVTHQDDLLYYDHAQRLGRYWNAIVAISDTIAEKIKSLDSSLAQRVTVIPHGLNIPSETPDRSIDPAVPLNVVCQGIFDDRELQMVSSLVRILRRREVPVEIALISAAGKSRTDILAHFPEPQAVQVFDDLPQDMMRETFEGADVVIMASKFDGVQNRLAEAMGRGCIPMVVEDERAMQQLIRDGENGFILPATDMKALADRLTLLQRDVSQRHIISLKAHETARSSVYPCAEMIEDYIETFSLVADQIHRGAFERHAGTLQPPPAEVNGVSIFPVTLSYKVEGIGVFPARSDYREFKEQLPLREFHSSRNTALSLGR